MKIVKREKKATMHNWHKINSGNKHSHLLTSFYLTHFRVSLMPVSCHPAWWNLFFLLFHLLLPFSFLNLWEFSFPCLVLCTSCRTFKSQHETLMSPEAWNIKNHTDFSSKSNHTHHRTWGREGKKAETNLPHVFLFFSLSPYTSTNKKSDQSVWIVKSEWPYRRAVQDWWDHGQAPFSGSVWTKLYFT